MSVVDRASRAGIAPAIAPAIIAFGAILALAAAGSIHRVKGVK